MASEQPPVPHANNGSAELVIAFVVESSLAVANDWVNITLQYLSPMLRRLQEANPGCKPRLAFITYAMADTRPSPLLCKRFFVDSSPVTMEMRDSPASLGIGSTNSGGNSGMAALEGLVAAIELFDVYMAVPSKNKQLVNHIFHIASASPDSSVHPRYNDSPNFDYITWEAIPAELKKAAPSAPKEPFFPTRSSHSVLLAGFPMSPQKPNTKRPADTHATPDPKRARLAPPVDVSPKVQTPNTPSSQPKPSPILPPQVKIQPPAQPQPILRTPVPAPAPVPAPPPAPTTVPNFPQPPGGAPQNLGHNLQNVNVQNVINAAKLVEEQIRNLHVSLQTAQNAGDAATMSELREELLKKQQLQSKFKALLFTYKQNQMRGGNLAQNQEMPVPPSNMPPSQPGMDQQAVATMLHKRTVSPGGPVGGQVRGPIPPQGPNHANMAAQMQQMQKMDLQRARMQPNVPGPSNGNAGMQPTGPPLPSHLGPPVDQRSPNKGPNSIWQGSISFSGTDASGAKKDIVVWVIGTSPNAPEISRTDTWPSVMPLQPAQQVAVPLADLQTWIQHHRPVLFNLTPQTHGVADPVGNETSFKALINLLIQRKAYAVSGWTLPSGEQGNNILFFPVNASSLGAACFPLTGLPELPKSRVLATIDLSNPELRARIMAMSPEQREQFSKQYKQHRALQAQQLMAQNGGNPGANNALMAMNAMNSMPQQAQQFQQQQKPQQPPDMAFVGNVHPPGNYGGMGMMNTMGLGQQPAMMAGMPRPVNAGMRNSMPPNINYEMMQSFMQRNPDSGGMGQ
ncbi:hypothetical protein C0991_002757 [Blastosporella zonata]|nr:hypothetical protein C0991_002757 [Blastosporella zonata]